MANLTRQELYDRIKESSKDEFILEEMKRLGFWEEDKPKIPEALLKDEQLLQKALNQLLQKQHLFDKKDELLKQVHKERMELSKERQKVTKEEQEKLRQEKAEKWEETQETDIVYLGEDVSKALHHKEFDFERLESYQLTPIKDVVELAEQLVYLLLMLLCCYCENKGLPFL